jgi:hypothetical protein
MNTLLWYKPNRWNFSVHCSAKAGSQTLLKAILAEYDIPDPGFGNRRAVVHHQLVKEYEGMVMAEEVPTSFHAYQFIRHPARRFESLWKDQVRDHGQGIPSDLWDCSPDDLLWYIGQHLYDNPHWCPQSVATPFATSVFPIEAMSLVVPGVNRPAHTTDGEVPEYDTRLLLHLYRFDLQLYLDEDVKNPR